MPSTSPNGPSPEHDRLRDLFHRASALPPAKREAFVRREAADDPRLADRALRQLAHADAPSERLRAAFSAAKPTTDFDADDESQLPDDQVQPTPTDELLRKLAKAPRLDAQRFAFERQIGEGGMGAVHRVHDQHLNRHLAVKLVLPEHKSDPLGDQGVRAEVLGRFLEEAQVTSQLDHPGVIPVHELGLDQHGDVFFMMRQVKGRTASKAFADAHARRNEWSLTRALEVVLKVCDTMSYAHARGVLHRDLKPKNVMVGRFGEVYVLDWGLAKVRGQADRHDERLQADAAGSAPFAEAEGRGLASSGRTRQGSALGTPNYMSPEQARGDFRSLDERTDVYAIGAMLYELLTGAPPYAAGASKAGNLTVRERVIAGPPPSVESVQPGVPAELVAIVGKAMERDREQRYRDTASLAADVRAFLGSQVVSAYRTGALAEMRMWCIRNRLFARSLATFAAMLTVCIVMILRYAQHNAELLNITRTEAAKNQVIADAALAKEARIMAEGLYPALPSMIAPMEAWLRDFDQLASRLAVTEHYAEALRQKARRVSSTYNQNIFHGATQSIINKMSSLSAGLANSQEWQSVLTQLQHGLSEMEAEDSHEFDSRIDAVAYRSAHNVINFVKEAQSELEPSIQARLREARAIRQLSIDDHAEEWRHAIRSIQDSDDRSASKRYGRLRIVPQIGLVPIGYDRDSLLWEFVHLSSGAPGKQIPRRDPATHRIITTEDTGIVFTLLPGGRLPKWDGVNDPHTESRSNVELAPFFMGKFELTQQQRHRLEKSDHTISLADPNLPATGISWYESEVLARHAGLSLPTELQWEYAIRAGTTTHWWSGDTSETVLQKENFGLAPRDVGSGYPNAFGLFDMGGNVREWCLDTCEAYGSEQAVDDMLKTALSPHRCMRGGAFARNVDIARSWERGWDFPQLSFRDVGMRATRRVTDDSQ
jgi:tRNA A-37 threonylcarbamoyl transferase component Bud32